MKLTITQIEEDTIDLTTKSNYIRVEAKITAVLSDTEFTGDIYKTVIIENNKLLTGQVIRSNGKLLSKIYVGQPDPVMSDGAGTYYITGVL